MDKRTDRLLRLYLASRLAPYRLAAFWPLLIIILAAMMLAGFIAGELFGGNQ